MHVRKSLGVLQTLFVNAVSIAGVFGAGWPIGTAIALYWAENVLRSLLLLFETKRVSATGGEEITTPFLRFAFLFQGAHLVFLAVLLGLIVPKHAPDARFEWQSFEIGVAIIAVLLLVDLVFWFVDAQSRTPAMVKRAGDAFARRIVVVHLTIVIGVFGVVLFGNITAFFAAFALLKILADIRGELRSA
ncbi:MAG: hypothetical protein JOZ54_08380 [Acidobacteria bacterium]|nr:hypothetical protein [Acidobacteriota bacterium]